MDEEERTPRPLRIPATFDVRAFAELRTDAEVGTFEGHAAVFWAVDSYGTAFAKKAFRKSLADKADRIPLLFGHDPSAMVGPVLEAKEDQTGLFFRAKAVDDGRIGSYVLAHLRGGTPMGMSFGFFTRKDRSAEDEDPIDLTTLKGTFLDGMKKEDVRVITEVELFELSTLPATFAAQPKADIAAVRSLVIDEISAAWKGAGPAEDNARPPTQPARIRRLDAEYGLLMLELGIVDGVAV